MKQARLIFVLVLAAGLAAICWWLPFGEQFESQSVEVVATVDRISPERINAPAPQTTAAPEEIDLPGNAFSVRVPPIPPVAPAPPAPLTEKPFVGPAVPPSYVPPPPPPPPPVQIVGTWDDAKSPGVFISSLQGGTVLARVGTVLLAEFEVTALTSQHVAVTHTSSKYEWRLPIPRAANP